MNGESSVFPDTASTQSDSPDPARLTKAPFAGRFDWQPSCFEYFAHSGLLSKTIPTEIMRKMLLVIPIAMLLISGIAVAQSHAPGKKFENQYLTMTISSGWAAEPSADQKLSITDGKYLLTINPIFMHATSVARFEQVAEGPSFDAVTSKLDDPSESYKCAVWPP